MKKQIYNLSLLFFSVLVPNLLEGQEAPRMCQTDEMMEEYLRLHPDAQAELDANEKFIHDWIENSEKNHSLNTASSYTIPVVYHVYGTTQSGKPVNLSVIQDANDNWVNKDFNGLNSDFGTVHTQWLTKRGTLSITFALAKKDPSGNPTNGVVNHPVKAGYGNGSGYDAQIAADAWDNYKYMNFYIMLDLYNDGVTNNSGVAWYPSTSMSNANTARIVYNGRYLGSNSWSSEFASTHSHEFGHWLDLRHTFSGGCTSTTNDYVADTPPTDGSQGCHSSATVNSPLNCTNILINAENYMDYNTDCYQMFTTGQIARMDAALQLPSRFPLWQTSNLINTGILNANDVNEQGSVSVCSVYPSPTSDEFFLEMTALVADNYRVEISSVLGALLFSESTGMISGNFKRRYNISDHVGGIYFLTIYDSNNHVQSVRKIVKQ